VPAILAVGASGDSAEAEGSAGPETVARMLGSTVVAGGRGFDGRFDVGIWATLLGSEFS
jgi:hypothetical protein